MRALSKCVHPSIRASGTVDSQIIATNSPECALELVLNRVVMLLTLPSFKRRAVVGDD
jgi:ubiquitin-protein ligase